MADELRKKAEELLNKNPQETPVLPTAEMQQLFHEIDVHQVELQMQNEELRQARDAYAELYDYAPVGYLTLDPEGRIRDANFTAATMLGLERGKLLGAHTFGEFVHRDSQGEWKRHRQYLMEHLEKHGADMKIQRPDGSGFAARVECTPRLNANHKIDHCLMVLIDISQRVKAEESLRKSEQELAVFNLELERLVDEQTTELRESEERFRRMFEDAPDASFLIDLDGRFIDGNKAVEDLIGYSCEELKGQSVFKSGIFPPAARKTAAERIERLGKGERGEPVEYVLKCRDGTDLAVEVSSMIIRLRGEVAILSSARDLTFRKQAEKQIRVEQSLFQTFMETLPAAVYFKDRDSRFLRVNQQAAAIFGVDPSAVIGKTDFDFYSEEDANQRRADELRVMQTRQPVQLEESFGQTWFLTTKAPRYDENGVLAGTYGISFDVTDKIRAQQELELSKRLLRSVIDTMHERVWWKDLNSVFLGCNLNVARDAGLRHPEEIVGKTDYDFCWKQQADRYVADDRDVIESGRPKLGILECQIHADGATRWIKTNKIPLHDNAGHIIGTVGTYEDITERRQAEARRELLEHQHQLALDAAQLGWWHFDPQTRISTYDRRLAEIFGIAGCERPVEEFYALVHPEDRTAVRTAGQAALDPLDPQPYGVEFRINHPAGSLRWIEVHGLAEFEGDGDARHATGFSGTVADITERMRMQEAIEKRIIALTQPLDQPEGIALEELFDLQQIQRLQDEFSAATGVASIITRPDGTPITEPSRFTDFCEGIIRQTETGSANCFKSDATLGRHHSDGPIIQQCLSSGLWDAGASIEVGGRHIANWLIGQVRDGAQTAEEMRAYARAIGADEAAFMEAFERVPVMPHEHFEEIAQALFTLANQLSVSAYQNMQQARFIAAQQRAERKLLESEEKYRKIFESESDAIMIFDGETRQFVDVNKAAEELYGYAREEFLTLTHGAISAEPDVAAKAIPSTLAGESSPPFASRHRKKDGTVFPVEITGCAFPLEGRPVLCGVIRDITERVERENELERNRQELRKLASELSLAEQRERQRIAAELHDGVSQLLSSIYIRLGGLQALPLPESAVGELDTISGIIQETLEQTRSLTFELSCPMLNELGLSVALEELCASMSHAQAVRFDFEGDAQPLPMRLDQQLVLYRSTRELLINVMKHSGSPWARVVLERAGENVRICVEDHGKGFDAAMAGKGFSPSGGFGLFNIREYLRHADGNLEIESNPGDGTQVVMTVPLEEEHG